MPYSFAVSRTIRNGSPEASDADGGQRDGAERRAGEADGVGLELAGRRREPLAERAEQLRLRLEAVLVEVVARAAAGAEDEVALEQRVLAELRAELVH